MAGQQLRRVAVGAGVLVAGVGGVVLAGWMLDLPRLRGPIPSAIEMKANSAVGFVLAGGALCLLAREHLDPRLRTATRAAATAVAVIGAVSLAEYLLGRNLGVDELLFHDSPESAADPTVYPGRLAPQTALAFTSLGFALPALDGGRRVRIAAEAAVVVSSAVALSALLGYLYGAGHVNAVGTSHPIAPHTAVTILVLGAGALLARPDRGMIALLRAPGPGSLLARRLLPVVLLAVPAVGWLRVLGQHAGLYDTHTGSALFVIVVLAVLSAGVLATARRLNRADRKRREDEELINAVVDNAPSVIHVTDADGRLRLVNHRFAELIGRPRAEIVGRTWAEILDPDLLKLAIASHHDVLRRNAPLEIESVKDVDGTEHTFRTIEFPLRDQSGRAVAVGAIATDVTERKLAEQAIREAMEEAQRANLAKSEFLSRMSHELRTPLAAIIGFGQLLEMGELTERQATAVRQILKGGGHLLDLINELLDISRIESGNLTISIEPVSVQRAIAEVLPMVEPLAAARGVSIAAKVGDADSRWVLADMQRLKQVLLNLLTNAIKYNREGGAVTVALEQVASREHIVVTDTGEGIPPDALERVFAPFERLHPEDEGIEGTGLGLALSRGLVEAMGGEIRVESEPGAGSSFSVVLDASVVPGYYGAVSPVRAEGLTSLPPCKILYIEDNPANLKLVEGILEHFPGVTLVSAMQGGLGVELALEHVPDLVLLDLNLPDIPGVAVLHRLLRHPSTASIPVVVLSADATHERIQQLLDSGARAYLTKPLEVDEFLRTLADAMSASQPVAS